MAEKGKENDIRYTRTLCIRLTEQEWGNLQKEADKNSLSVSNCARNLLKKRFDSAVPADISSAESSRRTLLAAKSVRNDFKSIAADYHEFIAIIKRGISKTDEVSASGIRYSLEALQEATASLQESVNAFLTASGEKEVHKVSRPARREEGHADDGQETDINLLFYMQVISIMGFVTGTVTNFTNSRNAEQIQFSVVVKTKDRSYSYTVQSGNTNVAPYLTEGRQVVVEGDFAPDMAGGELRIYAHSIHLGVK